MLSGRDAWITLYIAGKTEESRHNPPDSSRNCPAFLFVVFSSFMGLSVWQGRRLSGLGNFEYQDRKGKARMEERKYYISLDGRPFEVSRELYEAYYKGERKEKYFMHDLKEEREVVDKATGEVTVIPGREDSYERLLEAEKLSAGDVESVEDAAIRAVMLQKVSEALHMLTKREAWIIYALFYLEASEAELAKQMGIARTTLQYQKYKIFKKIKEILKV